jgi:hypothetical protein
VWPREIGLDGFTYSRFGGFRVGGRKSVAQRTFKWFIDWLTRSEPYTPQPHHQCAKVLREMGHPEMADDVLYAGRERQRREALHSGNNPRVTGLTLLNWFIGYGYGQSYFSQPMVGGWRGCARDIAPGCERSDRKGGW